METPAVGGLGRVGMGSGIGDAVAVGRPAAEVAPFGLGLGSHGAADSDLDAVSFAFGHAAEHQHDQVVGFRVRIDRPADLGDPELGVVVHEQGEDQTELVAVKRPVRFADDDGIEAAIWRLPRE
ncbi:MULTISPECIES: hypothetical protein [unclassified Frankia]|uniref:hypothetical protein n=1 Tax=unclassified Frankia TaxID=2632575 RepID=UPI001EE43D0D|nr:MULTISPECIES: hypothetical protein [unclassified Frankia]